MGEANFYYFTFLNSSLSPRIDNNGGKRRCSRSLSPTRQTLLRPQRVQIRDHSSRPLSLLLLVTDGRKLSRRKFHTVHEMRHSRQFRRLLISKRVRVDQTHDHHHEEE